jgi:hypothetical protein
MADAIDDAQVLSDMHLSHSLAAARRPIAIGYPGECENCDRDSPRLVEGWCAPCRDRRAKVSR